MRTKERLKEIPEGYYAWHIDQEHWQEISSLTEEELNTDDSEWSFVIPELLLSDSIGQYIPKDFYQSFDLEKWNIKPEDYLDLSGPELELYWSVWEELMHQAYCNHENKKYVLYQNGDLWAVHYMEDKNAN